MKLNEVHNPARLGVFKGILETFFDENHFPGEHFRQRYTKLDDKHLAPALDNFALSVRGGGKHSLEDLHNELEHMSSYANRCQQAFEQIAGSITTLMEDDALTLTSLKGLQDIWLRTSAFEDAQQDFDAFKFVIDAMEEMHHLVTSQGASDFLRDLYSAAFLKMFGIRPGERLYA